MTAQPCEGTVRDGLTEEGQMPVDIAPTATSPKQSAGYSPLPRDVSTRVSEAARASGCPLVPLGEVDDEAVEVACAFTSLNLLPAHPSH